jgi:hypothetical protein
MKTSVLLKLGFALAVVANAAWATAQSFVNHTPGNSFTLNSSQVTDRDPLTPRDTETVTLYFRVGYQFQYSSTAVYFTTDGTAPAGNIGFAGNPSTTVLNSFASQVTFVRNESTPGGVVDLWKATLPVSTRDAGKTIRYFMQAWGATTSAQSAAQSYAVKLAWPGAGSGNSNPGVGYPPYHAWKEEAVTGNNFINVMLDQNGSVYDIYYPGAGTVNGVASKNEGYAGGLDTFPAGLPLDSRGQLNMNQAFAGIRTGGTTYWMSNKNGADYINVTQKYLNDTTQTVLTTSKFVGGGANMDVTQYDFTPKGITFPNDDGGNPNRSIYVKRVLLKNNQASDRTIDFYWYMDPAINGGDGFDVMFTDSARGTMVAYDNTSRTTATSGEYNPTSFGSPYTKATSLYLSSTMKVLGAGASGGTPATDFWRDSSSDNGQGWIAQRLTVPAGGTKEVQIAMVGGFDPFAFAAGTYTYQMDGVVDWFLSGNMAAHMATTDAYWNSWVNEGTVVTTPDASYNQLFLRGKLGTALHLDGKGGGVVAGMHNGAYMYCWPRDAVWAAVTLARTGHWNDAKEVYRFIKDVAYRAPAGAWPGGAFWYQKYTLDGYTIWNAPQVDETAVVPWGAKAIFDFTGDTAWLNSNYNIIYDAGRASSEDSLVDSRLRYEESVDLVYSMNLWEDSFNVFNFSNANVIRGLWDAASIATRLNKPADAALFNGRAAAILNGLRARLAWNGENCDISQLGVTYPFYVLPADDPLVAKVADRINGVATDRNGNNQPLMNFGGEFDGLVNRYWGDTYWNGGPWFLSTLWYGCYYNERADMTNGKADIDNHKYRIDRTKAFNGPVGLGAEQMAPSNSLLYPGQTDFRLQAAWPNAWESMSFYTDAIMMFLDPTPDAAANVLKIEPKVPSAWNTLTFSNVKMGAHRLDISLNESTSRVIHQVKNLTGAAVSVQDTLKAPAGTKPSGVLVNRRAVPFTYDPKGNRATVTVPLGTGVDAVTTIELQFRRNASGIVRDPSTIGKE